MRPKNHPATGPSSGSQNRWVARSMSQGQKDASSRPLSEWPRVSLDKSIRFPQQRQAWSRVAELPARAAALSRPLFAVFESTGGHRSGGGGPGRVVWPGSGRSSGGLLAFKEEGSMRSHESMTSSSPGRCGDWASWPCSRVDNTSRDAEGRALEQGSPLVLASWHEKAYRNTAHLSILFR